MRCWLFICVFALCACVAGSEHENRVVSDLSLVTADPLRFDGYWFRGSAYVFVGEGYVAFFPQPVRPGDEMPQDTASILPGDNATGLANLTTGDRVLIAGRLRPDRFCFSDARNNVCTPWSRPVYIEDVQVRRATESRQRLRD